MGEFRFKRFTIDDRGCGMKIGTDSVLLGAWANVSNAESVLDLGCGSGLLALMCAQRNAQAQICAVEIDAQACENAEANFAASPWASRLSAIHADASQWQPGRPFDLIICNPPYFMNGAEAPDQLRAAARHAHDLSPVTALDCAAKWLSVGGSIALVAPAELDQQLLYHAEMLRLKLRRRCKVSTSARKAPTRAMWQFSRHDGPIDAAHLSIHEADGSFSAQYISLTKDFYLNF